MRKRVTQTKGTICAKVQRKKEDWKTRGIERFVKYQSAISIKWCVTSHLKI